MKKLKKLISDRNRRGKFDLAMSMIPPTSKVIDIGVDPTITGNTNYFERGFNYKNNIWPLSALGVKADFSKFQKEFPLVNLHQFDGVNFPPFASKFDFAFCNAVIEHVGDHNIRVKWLKGIKKLTETLMITTPNRWLPFETHSMTFFFHWLPDNMRNYIYRKIGKEHFANNYMWLLGEKDFKRDLRDAGFEITYFQKNKFLFWTIDFVAICKPLEHDTAKNYNTKPGIRT